jgi:hypothetical protein
MQPADLRPSQWNLESFRNGKENYTDDSCGYLKASWTHTNTKEPATCTEHVVVVVQQVYMYYN